MGSLFERGPLPKKSKSGAKAKRIWWDTTSKAEAGRRFQAWTSGIESTDGNWRKRFENLTWFRYMSGRATNASFNYSSVARPSSVVANYGRSQPVRPSFNVMAMCDDVIANRVYTARPEIQVVPIAGDFSARMKSKKMTRWLSGAFYTLKLWDIIELCATDSRWYGTGYLKVTPGLSNKVEITRICDDEVITDETECAVSDNPQTLGIRLFVARDKLLARFGDDEEALAAILKAPSVDLGFYFGNDLDVSDIVVLGEGWHLGTEGTPGRHIMTVGDYALVWEKYKPDHFPLAKLVYKQLPSGWRGQGLAEICHQGQRAIERLCAAFDENVQRMSWPKVGIEVGSNVNEGALSAKSGGTFKYNKTLPHFFTPEAITRDQFQYLQTLVQQVKDRVGISDQSARVEPVSGQSGIAIEKQAQLDQGRFRELSLHLQDFVQQVAVLLIEAAEKCKPVVTTPDRRAQQIKWSDVNMSRDSYELRPLPLSDLPQSVAGRQQIIDQWEAQNKISKSTANRLAQIPDIDGYLDLANAASEAVEAALDSCIEDCVYEPPTPFADLQDQLETAQSRYLFEKKQGDVPQERLDLLLQYIAATQELIDEANPPAPAMPAGPAPGFGIQAPGGPAPVTQPYPLTPNVPVAA